MTNEEFNYAIKSCGFLIHQGQTYYEETDLIKAFEDMGLIEQESCNHPDKCHECEKILTCTYYKQKSCEDAISRQLAIEAFKPRGIAEDVWQECHEYKVLSSLPFVNTQPKTGHWIKEINDCGEVTCWHCDKCYEDSGFITTCKWDFCPNCGVKMVEKQESEVKHG